MRSSQVFASLLLPPLTLRTPAPSAIIRLDSGWNLIGNPRPQALYWPHPRTPDTVRYRLGNVKGLWAWDHALDDYVKPADSLPMAPWRGYFVYSWVPDTLVTLSPTRVLGKSASFSSGQTWHIALQYGHRSLELGLATYAKTGFAVEDEPALPFLNQRRSFASLRQGRRLMADYLPLRRDSVSVWQVLVQTPDPWAAPEPLRLQSLSLPADFQGYLLSPSRRLKHPLSNLAGFTPAPMADTLLVVVGTPEALLKSGILAGKTEGLPGYALRLLPVGRGFLLELALPSQAKVEARLLDVKGRTVGELSPRWLGAGHHAFSFQKHFRAKGVPSRGVYFLQIRYRGAGLPAQTAKQIQLMD